MKRSVKAMKNNKIYFDNSPDLNVCPKLFNYKLQRFSKHVIKKKYKNFYSEINFVKSVRL